jgi:HK97 family phage major capsid protein
MSTATAQREKKQMPAVLPMQRRFFEVRAKKESDGLTPISFSSDTPVKRNTWMGYWWYEVLNHDRSAVDTGRLEQGISVLVNHDPDQRAGLLKNGAIEKGKGRGDIKFNTTDFGKSVRQEVEDGTLPYISVGYRVNEMNRTADINAADDEDEDYLGTYSVDRWEPLEVSLVAVPADPSVGVGRSLDQAPQYPVAIRRAIETASAGNSQEATRMATTATVPTPDQAAITTQVRNTELARFVELDEVHRQYPEHFTAEQRAAFAREGRSGDEARKHVFAEMAKRSGATAAHPATGSPAAQVVRDEADKREKGINFARFARCCAFARGNKSEAVRFAEATLKDGFMARALGASTFSGGGALVPETLVAEVIEFLRPQAVVRSMNPVMAPMVNGQLVLPKLTGGVAASYIGESKDITATQQQFGQVKATAKKLAVLVPISNDLIRYTSLSADNVVRDDMASGLAQSEDSAFIRGAGTAYSPKGLRNWAVAANIIAANTTVSLANTNADLGKLLVALRNANVRFLRPGWLFSGRTWVYLMTLLNANGQYVFRDELLRGTFWGYPYKVTTLIPENLNAGIDTEVYLADFADVVIAEVPNVVLETSTEASYFDGTQLQSAFSLDQTVIKMIVEHDLVVRHPESVAVLTTVRWQ